MTTQAQAQNNRILNIEERATDTGIVFWHVEDHTLPIITLNFAFKGAGATHDPADKIGLGQIASNTMDEGAGDRNSQQFQKDLDDHAIDLSFSNNRDHFSGQLRTITKHKALATQMLKDALTAPLFDDEALTRMKNANIMRIKSSLSNMDWVASRIMNDVFFGDHPYARNSGGTISGIQNITSNDLKTFVKTTLTKDRLSVAIAGDITEKEAASLIDAIFSTLPNADQEEKPQTPATLNKHSKPFAFESDSPQSSVQMTWKAFEKTDPDYYALRVFNHLFGGGGFSSALMEEVREKRGLTYGIYSRPVHMNSADFLIIDSATSPKNIAPMEQAVEDVIQHFKTTLIDEQKLKDAKTYLIGSLPLKFSSTQSLSKMALNLQIESLPITYLDQWTQKINAVTQEDIQRVANRIFKTSTPDAMVIAGGLPDGNEYDIIKTIPGVN